MRTPRPRSAPAHPPSTAVPGGGWRRRSDVAVTCGEGGPGEGPAARLVDDPGPATEGVRPAVLEVVVGAHLVAARAAEIRSVAEGALQRTPVVLRVRLDLVLRFDAAGVGLLLRLHEQARQRGVALVCSCPPRQLQAVLHQRRLDRVITVTS